MSLQPLQISDRVAALRPTAVNSILAEVREVTASGRSVISLGRGEPDFPTPAHITAAATAALARGRTSYPDNRGEMVLREAIVTKLARDNNVSYDPASEVLVTTGATFGIYAALTALLNGGEEVLVPDPVYDAYYSPIRLAGAQAAYVPSRIVNGRFTLDVPAVERSITASTRALLLNTPWNPVGTVLTAAEVQALAEIVLRHNLVLISDEIYEAIVYDGHVHVSPASLSAEVRARTLIVNSLSKTYAMTGWRVGYCAGPAPLIQAMFLVLQQSSRGPATFIQDAAAAALAGPQDAVEQMRREYAARLETAARTLDGIPGVKVMRPEGGFFVMLDIRETGLSSNAVRERLLREFGVVVVHGAAYGAGGEGTLRVSFASGGDTLARGLDRLREGLTSL
ncbi:MAG: aminotransferase class I/II-fold pyridoxal phosphate-dependent enzyme [Vicinamibacterales bacterium]